MDTQEFQKLVIAQFGKMDEIFKGIDEQLKNINVKLEEHDQRFEGIEVKLREHDQRFEGIEVKLREHDKKFEKIEAKLGEHDQRFDNLDKNLDIVALHAQRQVEIQDEIADIYRNKEKRRFLELCKDLKK